MEITKFVVNDRQILILGTDVGTIEIYYIDEISAALDSSRKTGGRVLSNNFTTTVNKRDLKLVSSLMRSFAVEEGKDLQIVKLKYARDVGLIVCALNDTKAKGILNFFDSVDFKKT